MTTSLKNTGIVTLNDNKSNSSGSATYIVIGVPRSGTSMVAKSLTKFGVFMGSSLDEAVYEDLEIANALEQKKSFLPELIKKRDEAHSVWGFKRPTAYKQLKPLLNHFRNPRIITTFRDPVAIAKRNSISVFSDFTNALLQANRETEELIKFVSALKTPVMLVSYEKAMSDKGNFIREISNFCHFSGSQKETEAAIGAMVNGPEGYLDASRIKLEGRIDSIKENRVSGWAHQIGGNSPLSIRLMSDGKVIGEGMANLFRNDLKKANKSGGHCAFEIDVSSIKKGHTVTAITVPFNHAVAKSTFL